MIWRRYEKSSQSFDISFSKIIIRFLEYRLISKKGEGTFSEVLKAQSTKTNKYVAIKCMKAHFYNIDQVTHIACFSLNGYLFLSDLKTIISDRHVLFLLNCFFSLGKQLARDPSIETSITTPQYHHSTWSTLVRTFF